MLIDAFSLANGNTGVSTNVAPASNPPATVPNQLTSVAPASIPSAPASEILASPPAVAPSSATSGVPEVIIGSQTLAPSHPITLGAGPSAPVISLLTNSAGSEEVAIGGSTIPLASYLAEASAAGVTPVITTVPALATPTANNKYPVLGSLTVSQASNGAYLLGTATLMPGSSITEVSGHSTNVVGLQVTNGSTELIVAGPSTTSTSVLGVFTPSADASRIVLNGQTFTVGGATLNAMATSTSATGTSKTTAAASPSSTHHGLASAASSGNMVPAWCAGFAALVGAIMVL